MFIKIFENSRKYFYNGSKRFLYNNDWKIHQFKIEDSVIKLYPFCWHNVLNEFTDNDTKKSWWHEYVYNFSANNGSIDNYDILTIHIS